jgi:ABC-type multidrug transport system fused ATPase/permease subunit
MLIFILLIVTDVTQNFSIALRYFTEMQNYLTSAQRMLTYTQLKSEDSLVKSTDSKAWPTSGHLKFTNVTMRYRETLEPAVQNLSFEVQAGMKVGIVGRTGSGKSSILQILFRLIDPAEGAIEVDGLDVRSVGLHCLRRQIGYIP